jgi:hypothetical protein
MRSSPGRPENPTNDPNRLTTNCPTFPSALPSALPSSLAFLQPNRTESTTTIDLDHEGGGGPPSALLVDPGGPTRTAGYFDDLDGFEDLPTIDYSDLGNGIGGGGDYPPSDLPPYDYPGGTVFYHCAPPLYIPTQFIPVVFYARCMISSVRRVRVPHGGAVRAHATMPCAGPPPPTHSPSTHTYPPTSTDGTCWMHAHPDNKTLKPNPKTLIP